MPAGQESARKFFEMMQGEEEKQKMYGGLQMAQLALGVAYASACKLNPMAADTAIFKEIDDIQKQFNRLIVGVSKLRGLN